MIEVLKTKNEFVYAYIEWFKVEEILGKIIPSDTGKRLHVYYFWVHPKWRTDPNVVSKLILKIKDHSNIKTGLVTWDRRPDDEKIRVFKVEQFNHKGGRLNGKRKRSTGAAS